MKRPTETELNDPKPGSRAVFLVEDHPITRAGLTALIAREPDLIVCGESDNAATSLSAINLLKPSIVLADIALKTTNGIELIKNLVAMIPGLPILAISMHDESLYAERAIRAGALGYLMKNEAPEKIIDAIRALLDGRVYLSEKIKSKLISSMASHRKGEPVRFPLDTLSDREMEVFELIGEGFTTREIALRLKLSTKTIDSYREHLKTKLNLARGSELVRHAIHWMRFNLPLHELPADSSSDDFLAPRAGF